VRRHNYEKEEALRTRVQAEPARPEVHTELAAWLYRAGRLSQAKEALQSGLAQAGRTAAIHHLLGLVLAGLGDWASAERHLARAATQQPTRFEYVRDLGLVQGAAGHTAASVETLRSAISMGGPVNPATGQADAAATLLWLVRVGEKSLAEAGARPDRRPPQPARPAAVVERLVSRDPAMAEALAFRRTEASASERENLKAARRALSHLATQHPSYPDIFFSLSLVAEQLGELDRAIEEAEKAITANPRYAEAHLLAVRLYERAGQTDRAAERCRSASDLKPQWIDAHLRLGRLMRDLGQNDEAAAAYRKALVVNGRCEEAKRGLEALQLAGPGPEGGRA
jgi:tetratricopeptide (TPR) repeat protein